MPSLKSPTVFVSSTCYDLSEIRDRLKSFIEDYGFDPLLSEFNSFPVNPLQNTIVNCRRNIDERADILVLIVGSRYGSTDEAGTSITNIEYVQARAKGIPIYVFISRSILEVLPVWKENPNATFSSVDSPKLFEFVDSLRNIDGLWTYPFDKADDIIGTLRKQWAYLFLDALQLWMKARDPSLKGLLRDLTGEALRLVIERPDYWEYRLYIEVLERRLSTLADTKRDRELGLSFGKHEHVEAENIFSWLPSQHQEIMQKIGMVNALFRADVIEEAFG